MKKPSLLMLFLFGLVFSGLLSCNNSCERGSGKIVSEDRKVAAFTKINVSGSYKLILKQGEAAVKVTADDNLLKRIETEVNGDELKISTKRNVCNASPMIVYVTNPDFRAVKSSGAVDLSADGKLTLKDFDMELAGSSKVNLNLNAANVTTATSGSSEINLTGQATQNNVTMSGNSNLNAFDFVVADYRIETSGASHCRVNVLNELSVNMSGIASVEYKGNPTKINNEHSGATSIKKIP